MLYIPKIGAEKMKKPKIIVYHNIIQDKKIFIVVFVRQPLDFDRAKEVLKKYSSLVYSIIPTGENAITFIEKTDETERYTPTTEEFMLGKLMLMTLPGKRGEMSYKEFKYIMKLYDIKKAVKFKVKEWYMKALEILKADRDYCLSINNDKSIIEQYDEAIKELEAYIIVYQTIRNRLDNTVITLAVLQDENETLKKIIINTRNGD